MIGRLLKLLSLLIFLQISIPDKSGSIQSNNNKEYVIKSSNKFLTKRFLPSGYCPHIWKIKDIDSNGDLRIENETELKVIRRF